jgi:DNA topoisomerase I
LPDVKENESLQLVKVDPQQKFTEPPARYTEASLVKTLEKLGIGRPSTYAPTISTIQDRQYVEKVEGKFHPTSLGTTVNDFLVDNFKEEVEYNFTAEMEESLDKIAEGEKKWVPVLKAFWSPLSKKIKQVEKDAERVKVETEATGKKCPICKVGDEVIQIGPYGKFLACSNFRETDCKYKAPYVETTNIPCPECKKGEVIVKKTRVGKKFFGCSRYPDCKWAAWKKPEVIATDQPQTAQ